VNVSGPEVVSVRHLAEAFGRRFGKPAKLVGQEARTAWLVDTSRAQRLFGPPRVPLEKMIDWQADWIAGGGPSLGKPTHFETRDGKY
jgi:nucleoside-diphosphate-sugar epimerase